MIPLQDPIIKRLEYAWKKLLLRCLRAILKKKGGKVQFGAASTPRKVLFIRQDRLGDVLISSPLWHAVRSVHPDWQIDILVSMNNIAAVENETLFSVKWIYEKKLFATIRLMRQIRLMRYDYILDLLDNTSITSSFLIWFSGARVSIGLRKENDFMYDINVPLKSRKENHILDRLIPLIEPLGVAPQNVTRRSFFTTKELSVRKVEKCLEIIGFKPHSYIAINISAGSESRFWGIPNFKELILRIRSQIPSLPILLLCKPSHHARAIGIAKDQTGVAYAPKDMTFDEFACYIKFSKLLISPDTAAIHLASAFEIPVVAMFVQSDPELRIWEPLGVSAECLATHIDRLELIPVDAVFSSAKRLLEGKSNV